MNTTYLDNCVVQDVYSRLYQVWLAISNVEMNIFIIIINFLHFQMVKLYMFSPVSGLYSCPLAMTDGAAKTIDVSVSWVTFETLYLHCYSFIIHRSNS